MHVGIEQHVRSCLLLYVNYNIILAVSLCEHDGLKFWNQNNNSKTSITNLFYKVSGSLSLLLGNLFLFYSLCELCTKSQMCLKTIQKVQSVACLDNKISHFIFYVRNFRLIVCLQCYLYWFGKAELVCLFEVFRPKQQFFSHFGKASRVLPVLSNGWLVD